MDNISLGEMELQQIPKEFRPNKHEHKSPWALSIILLILIAFGVFWFYEKRAIATPSAVIPEEGTVSKQDIRTVHPVDDLEAAVGAIEITDYSETL